MSQYTIAGTPLGVGNYQGASDWMSYAVGSPTGRRVGYNAYSSTGHYIYFLKFSVPAFSATSEGIDFDLPLSKPDESGSGIPVRWALLKSDSNKASYKQKFAAVADSNKIAEGTATLTPATSSSFTKCRISVNTTQLEKSKTYYLAVWPSGTKNAYATVYSMSDHVITVRSNTVYSITYNNNGGTGSIGSQSKTWGKDINLQSGMPTREGFTFKEWNTKADGSGTAYSPGQLYQKNESLALYAIWKVNSFKLTVSSGTGSTVTVSRSSSKNGGGSTGNLSNGATIYYGDVIKVTFTTSAGYTLSTRNLNGSAFTNGAEHTVTGNVTVAAAATATAYTLSLSQGANSTITVSRTGSPIGGAAYGNLSSGAKIYHGDVLHISFAAGTGYDIGTHTVNGAAFTSGGTHTVSGNVSIVSTASLTEYSLSISAGTGSSITVSRTSSPIGGASTGSLSNGAKIYRNDVLRISFAASTGYNLTGRNLNNTDYAGGDYTVTGNVALASTAALRRYTLNLSAGTGLSITVNRLESPLGNGGTGALRDGAVLFHGDRLRISFTADAGYSIGTHAVNGATFESGGTHTVSGDMMIEVAASANRYDLTVNAGAGTAAVIRRISSIIGGTGILQSGASLYYGDVLQVSYTVDTGYRFLALTMNGQNWDPAESINVIGPVTIAVSAELLTFPLEITEAAGVSVNVTRIFGHSEGETLGNGALLYYGDVMQIAAVPDTGYKVTGLTVNGEEWEENRTVRVTGTVTVAAAAKRKNQRLFAIYDGTRLRKYRAMIFDGNNLLPYGGKIGGK